MANKTKYTIYPDRIYVLEYKNYTIEVLGKDIFNAILEKAITGQMPESVFKDKDEL